MSEPTDAQRQKAAAELRIRYGAGSGSHPWIEFQGNPRLIVDQVLAATGVAPVPSSGVDEDKLAEVKAQAFEEAANDVALMGTGKAVAWLRDRAAEIREWESE